MFSQKNMLDEISRENLLHDEDEEAQSYALSPTRNVLFRWKLLAILSSTLLILHVLFVSPRPSPPLLIVQPDPYYIVSNDLRNGRYSTAQNTKNICFIAPAQDFVESELSSSKVISVMIPQYIKAHQQML
jgi:hypothetical protein